MPVGFILYVGRDRGLFLFLCVFGGGRELWRGVLFVLILFVLRTGWGGREGMLISSALTSPIISFGVSVKGDGVCSLRCQCWHGSKKW